MKISSRARALLFEAYRRNNMADPHEQSKPLSQRWLGLGTRSAYKAALDGGYMRWHDGRQPADRCMGWLVLTDKGIKALEELSAEFKEDLDRLNRSTSYQKSVVSQYTLAGGIVS